MGIEPQILFSEVMHKRLVPTINRFIYGVYYLAIPLSQLDALSKIMPVNRFGLMSFFEKDHGPLDGSSLKEWADCILKAHQIDKADGDIILICMPRIFGYVFNPISYWLCLDKDGGLRAVIYEVNNTFGENHSYISAHADQSVIQPKDILQGEKVFHVSPFMHREGHYKFRIDYDGKKFGSWIDFFDPDGKKLLVTSLNGHFVKLNASSKRKAFRQYFFVTLKTISLIHWQACKIVLKGIRYVRRPKQIEPKVTEARQRDQV